MKYALLLPLLALFILGCFDQERVAGTTTETTNGLTGFVIDSTGKSVSHARIELRTSDYNALKNDTRLSRSIYSDSLGKFTFDSLSAGVFNVRILNTDSTLIGSEENIKVTAISSVKQNLGKVKLERPVTVIGQWMPLDNNISSDTLSISIIGYETKLVVASTKKFKIPLVPRTAVTFYARNSQGWENRWQQNLSQVSDSAVLESAQLNSFYPTTFTKAYLINLSQGGANILSTINTIPFPLTVPKNLLNNSNYGFRFWEKESGNWLNAIPDHNSNTIDSANEIVWLQGTNQTPSHPDGNEIDMYYTKGAAAFQNPDMVFNSGRGYGPTWHFSGLQNGRVVDYSNWGVHGFVQPGSVKIQEGKVGEAIEFKDANSKISLATPSDFLFLKKTVSLSFWIYPSQSMGNILYLAGLDSLTQIPVPVLSISFNAQGHLTTDFIPSVKLSGTRHSLQSKGTLALNAWTHVVSILSLENNQESIFLNGVLDTTLAITSGNEVFGKSLITEGFIAGAANGVSFQGRLDEMQFYFGAWTPDQVQYLYYTQNKVAR